MRLTDEIDAESWITGRTYEESLILGPAVCAPTEGLTFVRCAFVGPADSMLIEIPESKQIQGIIGLRNVTFKDCVFQDVAFVGTPTAIARLREAMTAGQAPPEAQEQAPDPIAVQG